MVIDVLNFGRGLVDKNKIPSEVLKSNESESEMLCSLYEPYYNNIVVPLPPYVIALGLHAYFIKQKMDSYNENKTSTNVEKTKKEKTTKMQVVKKDVDLDGIIADELQEVVKEKKRGVKKGAKRGKYTKKSTTVNNE